MKKPFVLCLAVSACLYPIIQDTPATITKASPGMIQLSNSFWAGLPDKNAIDTHQLKQSDWYSNTMKDIARQEYNG